MACVFLSFLSNYIGSLSISAVKIPKPHQVSSLEFTMSCNSTTKAGNKKPGTGHQSSFGGRISSVCWIFLHGKPQGHPRTQNEKKRDTNFIAVMVKMITNQGKFQGSKICDPRSVLLFPLGERQGNPQKGSRRLEQISVVASTIIAGGNRSVTGPKSQPESISYYVSRIYVYI